MVLDFERISDAAHSPEDVPTAWGTFEWPIGDRTNGQFLAWGHRIPDRDFVDWGPLDEMRIVGAHQRFACGQMDMGAPLVRLRREHVTYFYIPIFSLN